MRWHMFLAVGLATAASASLARAELNAYYKGVDRTMGQEVPARTEILVAPGRVALVLKGSINARILFREDADSLLFVDDTRKIYFDVAHCGSDSGVKSDLEGQLSMLSPDERRMAEGLIQEALGSGSLIPETEYIPTGKKRQVLGYECTMVDARQNDEKFADYCGSKSKDFKLSDAETATMKALQRCLAGLAGLNPAAGTAVRSLWWDAEEGGFPLVTRCVDDGKVTFEVTLESFDRKKPAADPFAIPRGYARMDLPAESEPEE